MMNPFADQQARLGFSPIVTHFVWVCVYRPGIGNQLEEDKSLRNDNKFKPNYTLFKEIHQVQIMPLLSASRRGQAPTLQ